MWVWPFIKHLNGKLVGGGCFSSRRHQNLIKEKNTFIREKVISLLKKRRTLTYGIGNLDTRWDEKPNKETLNNPEMTTMGGTRGERENHRAHVLVSALRSGNDGLGQRGLRPSRRLALAQDGAQGRKSVGFSPCFCFLPHACAWILPQCLSKATPLQKETKQGGDQRINLTQNILRNDTKYL